jgi:hypothetical protein
MPGSELGTTSPEHPEPARSSDTPAPPAAPERPRSRDTGSHDGDDERRPAAAETRTRGEYADSIRGQGPPVSAGDTSRRDTSSPGQPPPDTGPARPENPAARHHGTPGPDTPAGDRTAGPDRAPPGENPGHPAPDTAPPGDSRPPGSQTASPAPDTSEPRQPAGDTPADQPAATGSEPRAEASPHGPAEPRDRGTYATDMRASDPIAGPAPADQATTTSDRPPGSQPAAGSGTQPAARTASEQPATDATPQGPATQSPAADHTTAAPDRAGDAQAADRETPPGQALDAGPAGDPQAPGDTPPGPDAGPRPAADPSPDPASAETGSRGEQAPGPGDGQQEHSPPGHHESPAADAGATTPAAGDEISPGAGPAPDAGTRPQAQDIAAEPDAAGSDARPAAADSEWPSAADRDRWHSMYQDFLASAQAGPGQDAGVVAEKPDTSPWDTSGLPPTGEELLDMEPEESRAAAARREFYKPEILENVHRTIEHDANGIQQFFERPPTGSHTDVPAATPHASPPGFDTVSGTDMATAALAAGIVAFELGRKMHHKLTK